MSTVKCGVAKEENAQIELAKQHHKSGEHLVNKEKIF